MNTNQAQELQKALEAIRQRTISNIYFVACGGSKAIFEPVQYICDSETDIPSALYTGNEFNYRLPKALGKTSLVVTCSHSGNTPETIQATKIAREAGALTVCFSFKPDSELWQAAEYGISYTWGPESKPSQSNSPMLYRLVFGLLNILNPQEKYERAMEALETLDDVIARNKAATLSTAMAYGAEYKREPIIYTMSSGECYGVAYSFSLCLLMEMQWIHSQPIHSGEYFHGPFEITDYDVPFLIILGRGKTRPMDERALAFAKKFSNRVETVDTAEFDMHEIPEDLQAYFAPLIAGGVLRQYADGLAHHRGHPLSVRRYMWQMPY